jgi:hypothetical protein
VWGGRRSSARWSRGDEPADLHGKSSSPSRRIQGCRPCSRTGCKAAALLTRSSTRVLRLLGAPRDGGRLAVGGSRSRPLPSPDPPPTGERERERSPSSSTAPPPEVGASSRRTAEGRGGAGPRLAGEGKKDGGGAAAGRGGRPAGPRHEDGEGGAAGRESEAARGNRGGERRRRVDKEVRRLTSGSHCGLLVWSRRYRG